MLSKSVIALALAALVAASPVKHRRRQCGSQTAQPTAPKVPTLPLNGGASELPTPASNLTLKHILLGHGIQNYTCATADASTTGTATGALAVLYDATPLFPNGGPSSVSSLEIWDSLPVTAALDFSLPLTMSTDTASCVLADHPGADPTSPFPSPALAVDFSSISKGSLPALGKHYFTNGGVPTFDLGESGLLSASVLDKVGAPNSASAGPDGQAAVAWLRLGAVAGGPSVGLAEVYRVSTVGGTSQACTGAGTISVPYTAMYWFYG